jgi:hypothetical protein
LHNIKIFNSAHLRFLSTGGYGVEALWTKIAASRPGGFQAPESG